MTVFCSYIFTLCVAIVVILFRFVFSLFLSLSILFPHCFSYFFRKKTLFRRRYKLFSVSLFPRTNAYVRRKNSCPLSTHTHTARSFHHILVVVVVSFSAAVVDFDSPTVSTLFYGMLKYAFSPACFILPNLLLPLLPPPFSPLATNLHVY